MYEMTWHDHCDFWVDKIEYMDMNRAYYLFSDPDRRDSTLKEIIDQCASVERTYGNKIVAWFQSDEPRRCSFRAHQAVNNACRDVLQYPAISPIWQVPERSDVFHWAQTGQPQILDIDPYCFSGEGKFSWGGPQDELDSLSILLENGYQAAQNTPHGAVDLHVTLQAFEQWREITIRQQKKRIVKRRNPNRAEIFAETFMALAHGARGISFFHYWTSPKNISKPDSLFGLVDTVLDHSGPKYTEKWQAVQDIFNYLDNTGDILLSLERDTAFCAINGGFISPLSNVYFEEEVQDSAWIEVGQFHTTQGDTDYVILVNRRTNAVRHITIDMDTEGRYTFSDIYHGKRFASCKGRIKKIPFKAGEGRIFRIEPK
jgi:hypothetical protein